MIAIVTNIDNDHLGTHGGDFARLCDSFVSFLHNLPFYGLAVLCQDDEHVLGILPRVGRPVVTYGLGAGADVRAIDVRRDRTHTSFEVARPGRSAPLAVRLNMAGLHNVRNALAAIAVATELEIADEAIVRALDGFQGIERRMQWLGAVKTAAGSIDIVDDYGHHPTEIAATLDALRQAWPGRRLVLAFQPHRYTRTRDLLDDFASVLGNFDVLLVTEVYAAGEPPDQGRGWPRDLPRRAQPRQARAGVRQPRREHRRLAARRAARRRRGRDDGRGAHRRVRTPAGDQARGAAGRGATAMSLELAAAFLPRVRRDEPMSRHTSWRVGGPADVFYTPRDRDELAAFLAGCRPGTPLMWVGLGSNLLVRDGGIRGVVICTHGAFMRLERRERARVYCEAGVPCARVTRQCASWGLGQAEFFAGIPGTMGGALAMNAGAYGGETWNFVRAVEVVARNGSCRTRQATEYQVGYRHVAAPANDEWFLAAELEFGPADPAGRRRGARAGAAPQAHAAARRAQLRLGVHESAR